MMENSESGGYKQSMLECVEYLNFMLQSSLVTEDEAESIVSYISAIHAALEVIEFYEGRDAILKVQNGPEFVEKLDKDWFKSKTAMLSERFGIDFT